MPAIVSDNAIPVVRDGRASSPHADTTVNLFTSYFDVGRHVPGWTCTYEHARMWVIDSREKYEIWIVRFDGRVTEEARDVFYNSRKLVDAEPSGKGKRKKIVSGIYSTSAC